MLKGQVDATFHWQLFSLESFFAKSLERTSVTIDQSSLDSSDKRFLLREKYFTKKLALSHLVLYVQNPL